MRIDQWLSKIEEKFPKKIAIIFKDNKWTYSELNKLIDETAAYLQNTCKLNVGDRFCFYGHNNPEQIILLFAASKIGAIIFPINWRLANPEIEYQIKNSKPKFIFFDTRFGKNFSNINLDSNIKTIPINGSIKLNKPLFERRKNKSKIESLEGSDLPLLLVYSSGTTGKPKGALLSQKSIIANAKMSHNAHSLQASDKSLIFLPLFHVGGINILFLPSLFVGATSILQEKFESDSAIQNIEKYKISQILTVPTILDQIISNERWKNIDRNSIKTISIGSTSVPLMLIKSLHACKIPLIQIYGATETGPIAIYQKIKDAYKTEGSIGRVGLHCKVKLVDDSLKEVKTGSPGQILVKGENILSCYWEDAQSTMESIVDGWFLTGDIAKVDKQGNYWFIDRIKNVIISGGENIYPAELEVILKGNGLLKEFSIVGKKDLVWGEVPVIIAVKQTEKINKDKILEFFEGQVAKYKIPKDIIFVDNLPKNALGKIMVDEVKKLAK